MALIVVADDDVDIRDLVEFKLATLGHQIVTVADGSSAVAACRNSHPDLAVLDVMMPGLTGLEAVKEMRANPDICLLYTSPSPRDGLLSRMPSSA